MGTYSLEEMIQRWFAEDLTAEQIIGQILQVLQELSQRVNDLENRNRPEGIITTRKRS